MWWRCWPRALCSSLTESGSGKVSLFRFWESTRLRAEDAKWTTVNGLAAPSEELPAISGARPEDPSSTDGFLAVLAAVLSRGCGQRPGIVIGKAGTPMQARTTPSAGALYPFDVLVTISDGSTYLYEVDAARLARLPGEHWTSLAELAGQAGLITPHSPLRAVVTLVARPWRAMAKYGQRGYLYTYLDIGHAASNIARAARAVSLVPVVHLRFHRQKVAETLGLSGLCREPQIGVTLSGSSARLEQEWFDDGAHPVWRDDWQAGWEAPGPEEQANWVSLREVSSLFEPTARARVGRSAPVVKLPPGARPTRATVAMPAGAIPGDDDFPRVALQRHSAKAFLPKPIRAEQVAGLLDGLADGFDIDCAEPPSPGVGLRMLVRHVDGLAPGAYAYSPDDRALHPLGTADAAGDSEVMATCMGQAGLRHAAVLVHLHATLGPLLRHRRNGSLAEVLFHAAHAAQLLCLNAARHGLGITCVGGFDEVRCAALTLLPEEEEVIYLIAAGVPDPAARKLDRAAAPYSHGRTSAW